jgi:hypothetical protein
MGMATLEILQALQKDIGPRPAGTAGERRAQQWLQARCEALGLPVELDEFTFIGSEAYRPLLQLTMLTLIAGGIILSFAGRPLAGVSIVADFPVCC